MNKKILQELEQQLNFKIPDFVTFVKGSNGLNIEYDRHTAVVEYSSEIELSRAVLILKCYGFETSYNFHQKNCFDNFGLMVDCSRNAVLKKGTVKELIRLWALMGYNSLQLYTEDVYEVNNEPYFGYLRGRYTTEELKELDAYAQSFGVELIPCIQTLAHLGTIMRWGVYRPICDCNDILLCGEDHTYELLENIFSTLDTCFTSRRVNIGMDEAHMVGLGKYLDINGYKDRFGIILEHLKKVAKIADKYGFKPMMWSDMFFRLANNGNYNGSNELPKHIAEQMPDNVDLVYWDYYSDDIEHYNKQILSHKKLNKNIWFAGGVWKWTGFVPHNNYSMKTIDASVAACANNGIKDMFTTAWGDNGAECSIFSILPSLLYLSEKAYGNNDSDTIKKMFLALTDMPFDDFLAVDLPNHIGEKQVKYGNPHKYFLYNDIFLGIYDCYVKSENKFTLEAAIQSLKKSESGKYGYIFKTLRSLCEVLFIKYDLGVKTRELYKAKDMKSLEKLVEQYDLLITSLENFYILFREQWEKENKAHGFEVQDIRIGGLIQRTKHCKTRLMEFLDGKLDKIEELEENIIDCDCGLGSEDSHHYINNWSSIVSVNNM